MLRSDIGKRHCAGAAAATPANLWRPIIANGPLPTEVGAEAEGGAARRQRFLSGGLTFYRHSGTSRNLAPQPRNHRRFDNSTVIPAQAGIQRRRPGTTGGLAFYRHSGTSRHPAPQPRNYRRFDNSTVIPAQAGIQRRRPGTTGGLIILPSFRHKPESSAAAPEPPAV